MIEQIISNKIIIAVVVATMICHIWKFLHVLFWEKKVDWTQFIATGGMPSSHATFVTSLALSVGFVEGWISTIFIVSVAFAAIVVRDAFGVRQTVDDLIKTVNEIINQKKVKFNIIKKIAGHTPVQTVAGILLGAGITVPIHLLF